MAISSRTPAVPGARGVAVSPTAGRRPFRDNPRLILVGIVLLLAVLASLLWLADRSARLSPDFLTGFVLYALSATNFMMLLALGFFLVRNVVKLLVERRRALPFARFRAKLVALLLGLTLVPAVLVLAVGSQVVLTAVDRWFNAPMDEVLSSASMIASDYYQERQRVVSDEAARLAAALSRVDLANDIEGVRAIIAPDVTQQRIGLVQVYRVAGGAGGVQSVVDVAAPDVPTGPARAGGDRLAALKVSGSPDEWTLEPVPGGDGGQFLRVAQAIRSPDGRLVGVIIASDVLTGEMAERARRMTQAYEAYTQLRVLKQPLAGVYLSFFVMVTLLILVGSTWMGLYLAKRITRPVQMLSAAAREIGAGRLEHRIEHQADDEFGNMVESFNAMAADLSARQRSIERAAIELEQRHHEVERRHRSVETILERIATGVVSIDVHGAIGRVNSAAARLLGLGPDVEGRPIAEVLGSEFAAVTALITDAARARGESVAQEVAVSRDGREMTLAVAATRLHGAAGFEGTVVVLDDVTPLIRAQKVAAWREVARRLAHEIKNPLTPIQLSAERLQRKLGDADAPHAALVRECTDDHHRRGRVAQGTGRRVLAVRADAGAAGGADVAQRRGRRRPGALRRACSRTSKWCGVSTTGCRQCGSTPSSSSASSSTWSTTPSRPWISAARSWSRPRAIRPTRWSGWWWPTTARASRRASATSCSCRTTPPSGAARGSGWRSCGASSPSTAATSK